MNMFRKLILSAVTLLLLTGSAFAAETKFVVPKQKVTGAEEPIPANELVILKVTMEENRPKYLQDIQYSWLVLADGQEKKNVLLYPDNTTIGFGRGSAKKIQVILTISYLYAVREGEDALGKIIEVGQRSSGIIFIDVKFSDNPGPGPGPDPNPNPDPNPIPDGKFKLAKATYDLATTKVPAANRVKGAEAMATATAGISSSIRAGVLKDPTEILKKLKDANNAALTRIGVTLTEWDEFGVGLQAKLVELYRAGKLSKASDYADAFDEIAIGLNRVK